LFPGNPDKFTSLKCTMLTTSGSRKNLCRKMWSEKKKGKKRKKRRRRNLCPFFRELRKKRLWI